MYKVIKKEEAIKIIQDISSENVIIEMIDRDSFFHGETRRKEKIFAIMLINAAKDIKFQDNDFFGVITCCGSSKRRNRLYNILFLLDDK